MSFSPVIKEVQKLLKEESLKGWLLYDFRGRNTLACKFLKIPKETHLTRRFCYWIPAEGEPLKIVHAVESFVLDYLPGKKETYASWQSFQGLLSNLFKERDKIILEYSEMGSIPYVSTVDGGMIDFLKSLKLNLFSSGDILQHFTATVNEESAKSHLKAASFLDKTALFAFKWVEEALKENKTISEYDVQQFIVEKFEDNGFITDSPPIVAVNKNSSNPHYAPSINSTEIIRRGDFILIDLWAKEKGEGSIYGDITRVGVARKNTHEQEEKIFNIVREAQKKAFEFIKNRLAQGKSIQGFEVDDVSREVIEKAGYGPFFIHRTGHSIHEEGHGEGANIDNLETHEERKLLNNTIFSIEPGIYLPDLFGVRLEHDVFINDKGEAILTGGVQDKIYTMNL
ncbi:M24 family metallopeptidase [Criblamydia sequanensis]|uniref:Metallopeptidase n=1 Tax=Candidatus Criblamydia sequanensis CRIB-18 TaxID=1437425 RepID=A0A090DZ86_9BACT|nr:M24 family metallopeptidase [Criblamydia sequanensis]CDR33994.1 Metallopeptidase [Criblamydia sequanensis CRIB-18]